MTERVIFSNFPKKVDRNNCVAFFPIMFNFSEAGVVCSVVRFSTMDSCHVYFQNLKSKLFTLMSQKNFQEHIWPLDHI